MDAGAKPSGGPVLMHGLVIAGEVAIAGASAAPPGATPDLTVRELPAAEVPEERPEGDLVAALDVSGTRYEATRQADKLRIRFHGAADFEIDLASGEVEARPAPGREGMLPVLLAGNVIAIVLGLRGEPVLHASAVVSGSTCAAIAGPSGVGKSTVAYLLCAAGMELLTDDTARIGTNGELAAIHRGSHEVRLRGPAAEVARKGPFELRETADARTGAHMPSPAPPIVPLGCILFPVWSEETTKPAATRLGERQALDALMSSPRVAGWVASTALRANFECFAQLAFAGAHLLELPRGRLDDPGFGAELAVTVNGALTPEA